MFRPVDIAQIQAALASGAGWIELVIVIACIAVAWLIDHHVRAQRAARGDTAMATATPADRVSHVLFPLVVLLLLFVARIVHVRYATPLFLDIALPLALAVAATRVLIYALRRMFPQQRWLPGWERGVVLVVLAVLVLHYVGVLPQMLAELDTIAVPIGKSHITLLAIGRGVLVVLVTLVVTLWISGLIEQRLLTSDTVEGNLRVVLAKSVRAVLLLVAILLSLQAVGIDLTVLSVFGGALGVGIGLGLQKLASNYIAGFTILLDRSIRIGDIVTVDNRYGTIARVTSRYVVVRGMDGVESIVPNETLVTTTVLNHTYTTKDIRIAITVRVSYDSDVEKALDIMRQIAASEPRVLRTPPPGAFVARLGETAIELELGVWINDPEAGSLDLRSSLNRKVLQAFRTHSIAIASPDYHLAAAQSVAASTTAAAPR